MIATTEARSLSKVKGVCLQTYLLIVCRPSQYMGLLYLLLVFNFY